MSMTRRPRQSPSQPPRQSPSQPPRQTGGGTGGGTGTPPSGQHPGQSGFAPRAAETVASRSPHATAPNQAAASREQRASGAKAGAEPRPEPRPDPTGAANERIYRVLRNRIMNGEVPPGRAMTVRGLGKEFGVSMTPAREAIRRLAAEGALTLSATGRVATPELTPERVEELAALRALLEPELAARALPRAHQALIERMAAVNANIAQAVAKRDAAAYIRANLEFHRSLYLRAQAPAMLAMVETVWLQLGPTMSRLYARKMRHEPPSSHRMILAALRAGDEPALRLAVRNDVGLGLRMLD